MLLKIWIEKVGRAQQDIPAHIAQVYCHPRRSFKQVSEKNELLDASNPANLKRNLKFFNNDTDSFNFWFPSNANSEYSYAILRGAGKKVAVAIDWNSMKSSAAATIDYEVLTTIDQMRTQDREQSLLNLSQPLNPQESPFFTP